MKLYNKRLFTIKSRITGKIITPNEYFRHKADAKRRRDELNEPHAPNKPFFVTLGPDHRRYED